MSDRAQQIRKLKDDGLYPAEIARNLGISRALVNYHLHIKSRRRADMEDDKRNEARARAREKARLRRAALDGFLE